ncbi:hypothetical protein C1H46_044313 [Malus baccata]|uniref:Uncharacterized protein n=1 Tax=Malus baccata TaxID=106549 RepID=A0A540K7F4_MALBA|nr:hypothetical protein C1H46_044313 [Malus baccata]
MLFVGCFYLHAFSISWLLSRCWSLEDDVTNVLTNYGFSYGLILGDRGGWLIMTIVMWFSGGSDGNGDVDVICSSRSLAI